MNWRRGLIRLWVLGSVIWCAFVGAYAVTDWRGYRTILAAPADTAQGTGLANFRAKPPQYNDMSDQELAETVYDKYYKDKLPRDEYDSKMGLIPSKGAEENSFASYAKAKATEQDWKRIPQGSATMIWIGAAIAAGSPVLVLVLVAALWWTIAGFTPTKPN